MWWLVVCVVGLEHTESGERETLGETRVIHVERFEETGALAPHLAHDPRYCLDTAPVLARYGGRCVGHAFDALEICAQLDDCRAVECLPFDTFLEVSEAFRGDQLLRAAARGDVAAVRRELDKGVDVDAVDARQRTPLMLAGSYEVVAELLKAKASSLMEDSQGLKAIDFFASDAAIIDVLTQHMRAERLALSRLDVDDPLEAKYLLRGDDEIAAQIRASVRGRLCFFAASHADANDHAACDANATVFDPARPVRRPRRGCTRHLFHVTRIADAIDMATLPPFAARQVADARREMRTVLVYDYGDNQDELSWRDNLIDIAAGRARSRGGGGVGGGGDTRHIAIVDGLAAGLSLDDDRNY